MEKEDRLSDYMTAGLGLERTGVVRLVQHNPAWKDIFSAESALLKRELAIEGSTLHHCGSTSIPGISAKPIIDVVGSVPFLKALDEKKPVFERLGYEFKGEYGILGRRYCVLYNPGKTVSYFHLHFFAEGDPEIKKHLLFRDYLRAEPNAAQEYENLKRRLVDARVPRSGYSDAKSELIATLIRKAVLWTERNAPQLPQR